MGRDRLVFDWMEKDECLSHVEIDFSNKVVRTVNYTPDWRNNFFGKATPSIELFFDLIEDRCVDPRRPDIQDFLDFYGIPEYDELEIVKITHGMMIGDFYWMRFEGETITYSDLRPNGRP